MGRLRNVLFFFLPEAGRGKAGSRPQKSLSSSRRPNLEALEDRIFPSVTALGHGLTVEASAGRGPPSGPAALAEPGPPTAPDVRAGSPSAAGDSPRSVGVVVD